MKHIKKVGFGMLLVVLLAGCGASSGSEDVHGTYTTELSTEELAGNTRHNGFVTAIGLSQKNTVTLNEDGTYEYIKLLSSFENGEPIDGDVIIEYTFIGNYENENESVTLNAPTKVDFDENWASLNESGHLSSSTGSSENGDMVTPKEGEEYDPMNTFLTPYYQNTTTNDSSVTIILDKDANTFTYGEIANTDDD